MAYPFFNSWQQQSLPQYPWQMQPQQPAQSGINWVLEAEVDGYPVAPNCAVALWDRQKPCIYVKQADATGRTSVRIIDYKDRSATSDERKVSDELAVKLATKDDVAAVADAVRGLETLLKGGAAE